MTLPSSQSRDQYSVEAENIVESNKKALETPESNYKRLNECPKPHHFNAPCRGISGLVEIWKCAKCGGSVSAESRFWYNLGLQHGLRHSDPRYPDVSADGQRHDESSRA